MKIASVCFAALGLSVAASAFAEGIPWPSHLPVYDHIVVVVEENKNFEDVVHNSQAPYLDRLISEGALFTKAYGEEHNSEGNYFWLFAGDRFDIGFRDEIPSLDFSASNLAQRLIDRGLSFKGYAEDLPQIGSTAALSPKPPCGSNCGYARKHVPWVSFPALCKTKDVRGCASLPFTEFPRDFSRLPTVSMIVPNLIHDMHSVDSAKRNIPRAEAIAAEVAQGDAWLRENLDGFSRWAKSHNSLLIITFDENSNSSGIAGLTDPAATADPVRQNRIATVFVGAHIKAGTYEEGRGITHVNILRTIEAMYRLPKSGGQQANAAAAGIQDNFIITDVFE